MVVWCAYVVLDTSKDDWDGGMRLSDEGDPIRGHMP